MISFTQASVWTTRSSKNIEDKLPLASILWFQGKVISGEEPWCNFRQATLRHNHLVNVISKISETSTESSKRKKKWMTRLVSRLPEMQKRENWLSQQPGQIPHLLQRVSSYRFTSPLQSLQLKFQSSWHIFLVLPNFLAFFLLHTVQGVRFMLIPVLIRTSERLLQECKMDPKLLALSGYCFFPQLLFPNKICQLVSPDPDVIIAWLSNKSWFRASNEGSLLCRHKETVTSSFSFRVWVLFK